MATSIKLKFIPSKIKGKAGVICLQLIRNRKVKLLRTRFRLFPNEWDKQNETIIFDNSGFERQNYLQSIKLDLEVDLKQLADLIRLLETKGNYTVEELAELYASDSFNGCFFPFADYIIKKFKTDNPQKRYQFYKQPKQVFSTFFVDRTFLSTVLTTI